jgi:hypothetical protein
VTDLFDEPDAVVWIYDFFAKLEVHRPSFLPPNAYYILIV